MNSTPSPHHGAPYGNQNARKHGMYSRVLSPAEICDFWNIARLEGIDLEIAVLRIKLRSLLQHDPGNYRAVMDAARLIAKWYRVKYWLDREDGSCLKKVVRNILRQAAQACDDFYKTNLA